MLKVFEVTPYDLRDSCGSDTVVLPRKSEALSFFSFSLLASCQEIFLSRFSLR